VCQRTKTLKTPFSQLARSLSLRAMGGELRASLSRRRRERGRARGGREREGLHALSQRRPCRRRGRLSPSGCVRDEGPRYADGGRRIRGHLLPP